MHNELPSYSTPPAGAIRFNTDSNKLEVYRGGVGIGTTNQTGGWWQIDNWSPENQTGGTRGVFGGGDTPAPTMDYVNVSTTGNAIDFDDLTYTSAFICKGGASSRVRGLFQGGRSAINNIDGFTFASTGSAFDFGNLTQGREDPSGVSNSTRGVFMAGGQNPGVSPLTGFVNTIDYVTIASAGDAVDFGDTTTQRRHHGTCASSTRGIAAGGYDPSTSPNATDVIDFITISTLGNAADFGNLPTGNYGVSGASNAIRGIFSMGDNPTRNNAINYLTIATLGDAIDFGDLIDTAQYAAGVVSSPTRVCFGGGNTAPLNTNRISYVQIATTGDAIDFGDLTVARQHLGGTSNGHGGL